MESNKTIKQCVDSVFNRMKDGDKFSGLQLKEWVVLLNPKYEFTYPDTILREARRNHRNEFRPFNSRKSIYIVTKSKE